MRYKIRIRLPEDHGTGIWTAQGEGVVDPKNPYYYSSTGAIVDLQFFPDQPLVQDGYTRRPFTPVPKPSATKKGRGKSKDESDE